MKLYELITNGSSVTLGKEYEVINFGENAYSNGMKLISSSENTKELLEKVLIGSLGTLHFTPTGCKILKVYLNPSAKCSDFEFYGVLGTKDQYDKLYQSQKDAQISKQMISKFGWNNWPNKEVTDAYRNELITNYKDWWEK